MITGTAAWLLRKRRSPRELNDLYQAVAGSGKNTQCLAWSWRAMSEWISEIGVNEDEIISRKIREFERLVVLTKRPPVPALHQDHRYVVETLQRDKSDVILSYHPFSDPVVVGNDQQAAFLAYAQQVQNELAFMEETERRRHIRLSEDVDLDVDLHRFQAWSIAAPVLRDLKRADRQYASARRRLLAPAFQALQVGIPAVVLAAECGRTRQWLYQTTDSLKNHDGTAPLMSLTHFLDSFGVKHPGWKKGLVTSGELPLVAVDAVALARVVEWIVDGDDETETDATISRDQSYATLKFHRKTIDRSYGASDVDWRLAHPDQHIESDLTALTAAGMVVNTSTDRTDPRTGKPDAERLIYGLTPRLVKIVVTLDLPVTALVHPPKRGRPPGKATPRDRR